MSTFIICLVIYLCAAAIDRTIENCTSRIVKLLTVIANGGYKNDSI